MTAIVLASAAIQHADIVDSLTLTEQGKRLAEEAERTEGKLSPAHRLAWAVSLKSPTDRADIVSEIIRGHRSIVAAPANLGPLPNGSRVVVFHHTRRGGYADAGGLATVHLPAHHLDGNPTPRELAKTVADLLE